MRIAGRPVLQSLNETVIGLGIFATVAVLVGMLLLRTPSAAVPLQEGRRLTENIGWAAVLPQLLATLGLVFATATAGVGQGHRRLGGARAAQGSLLAAFPVMTAGIGYPLLIQHHGGTHRPPCSRSVCWRATAERCGRPWRRTSTSSQWRYSNPRATTPPSDSPRGFVGPETSL